MKKNFAEVSVILPVYNAQEYIYEAVDSILNQSFNFFELIIINDGSTDNTDNIIKKIDDERIRYYSRENRGLTYTLNELADLSNCDVIARMDADDICHKDRLKLQYKEFEKNDKLVIVSTNVNYINERGDILGTSLSVSSNFAVRSKLKKGNIIFHPTAMFKKEAFIKAGKYNTTVEKYVEDYLLWMSMLNFGDVKILRDTLLSYRVHSNAISSKVPVMMNEVVLKIAKNQGAYLNLEKDYNEMVNGEFETVQRKGGFKVPQLMRWLFISVIDILCFLRIK